MAAALLVPGTVAACAPPARAQAMQAPDPMALNRAGRWAEALAVATRSLADPRITGERRCALIGSAAFSLARSGRRADAAAVLDSFDAECTEVPIDPGVRAEVTRLRGVMAGQVAPTPTVRLDLDDLPRAGRLSRAGGTPTPPPALESNADRFWQRAEPGTALQQFWLRAHDDLCARTGADACLIVRHGQIASEWYRTGAPDALAAMSSTKSVTGLVAMRLLADGKLPGLDAPVCGAVHQWCDARRRTATVRHLLTMTSGLPPMIGDSAVGLSTDLNAFVEHLRPTAAPGTRWAYSIEGVQLLAPVLDQAAGEPMQQYARRRLFAPLGMRDTRFHLDRYGHAATYANLMTTPRDLARVGLLVLQHGRWQGRQVLPAALVDSLVRPSQTLNPRYGMLWWRLVTPNGNPAYVTRGYLATNMYVFPYQDVVVVRMQNLPRPGNPDEGYETAAAPLFRSLFQSVAPAHWH